MYLKGPGPPSLDICISNFQLDPFDINEFVRYEWFRVCLNTIVRKDKELGNLPSNMDRFAGFQTARDCGFCQWEVVFAWSKQWIEESKLINRYVGGVL